MTTITKSKAAATGEFQLMPFKEIVLGINTRTTLTDIGDLAESIAQYGLQSPLRVAADGTLLAGFRRHAAITQLVNEKRWSGPVPVLVGPATDARSEAIMHLIENLQRVDLDPVDEAFGFQQLAVTHGMSAEEIGSHVRRSTQHVKDRIALCVLPENILEAVRAGKLTIATANKASKLDVVGQGKLAKKLKDGGAITDYTVDEMVSAAKKKAREEPFRTALKNAGFKIESYLTRSSDLNSQTVTGIKALREALGKVPSNRERKVATLQTYSDPLVVTLYWSMTPAEAAKAEAKRDKDEAKREAEREARRAQQEAEAAERRAVLPEDVKVWFEQVRALRAEWAANSTALRTERSAARLSIVSAISTKDVAAMALRCLAMEMAGRLAWLSRAQPDTADAFLKTIGVVEADIVTSEDGTPDWRATIGKKAAFVTTAAALELHYANRAVMADHVNAKLEELGLADPVEEYPLPPAHLNPDRGDTPVTWEEANAIVEALLGGEVAVSDEEYDDEEYGDDD